jgi:hypothetical protein
MDKSPGVTFEFGRLSKKEKCPRVKFDFEPLNPKQPPWAPKMSKIPRSKI